MMREAARNPGPLSGAGSGSGGLASVRRIQRELKEISESPSRHWTAAPEADDLFIWQFAIRGPPGTDFEGGIYTGRLVLPVNYPMAPPSITLLTPNGRWEVGKKICLSNSSYHPELWQPAWGIRTMMEALRSHFPHPGDGAIGALDWPSELRKKLAQESLDFVCPPGNKKNRELLPELTPEEAKEELPEVPTPVPVAEAVLDSPVAAPVQQPPVGLEAMNMPGAADPSAEEGLRQRGGGDVAPPTLFTPLAQQPGAPPTVDPPVPVVAAPPASRRRRDNTSVRPQRRQQPILIQLVKPPQTKRGWVLLVINLLLCLLAVSFLAILIDIIRDPPQILEPATSAESQAASKGG